ncbi:hypothetical protein GIB67_015233 [Kingdonia uniflora]|uniref:Uncharacterized protein n=1 Tax=Kingdonia uniflora TaxID=39325 RepID=A0A7J7MSW0_9MAGN|nr:hypothetical protein GIB67_015233 [Kingdonia uniflora]
MQKKCQTYAYKQREKQKQVSSNQVLSMPQCRKRKVDIAISDSGGTSIDQSVQQTGIGLIISNLVISNTINKDISQAWMNMNTALLDTGNPIDTNVILESDHSATIANSSVILSANTTAHKLSNKLLTFEQQEKRDLTNSKRRQAYANKQRGKAWLNMNTALLATGNPIDTNVILEPDHSTTIVNSSAILSANTAGHKLSDKLLTFEQLQEKRDLANAKRREAYANKQREKPKQDLSSQVLSMQQCRKRKVYIAISDSGRTSIDQSVEQNGMGLIISNRGINNTINRDISQACLIMNTTLLATGNAIGSNVMLESDQSATTVNPSAIVSANITGMSIACIPNTSNGSVFNKIHTSTGMAIDDCNGQTKITSNISPRTVRDNPNATINQEINNTALPLPLPSIKTPIVILRGKPSVKLSGHNCARNFVDYKKFKTYKLLPPR